MKGEKMKHKTAHHENIVALKRIEGHLRGIQKMIDEEKYCIDIIIQIYAVINALYGVSEKIFAKHIESCVASGFESKSPKEKNAKIQEIVSVVHSLHKLK